MYVVNDGSGWACLDNMTTFILDLTKIKQPRAARTVAGYSVWRATSLLIRPGKTSKLRKYWNWYHHWVGSIALLIGFINVFYGVKAAREPKSWYEYLGIVLAVLGSGSAALEVKNIYSKYFQ
ncbi:Cytochrome b561 and DOMON domain-containing protein [Nymphaea thermarum]|nr:Cytochrome b561 and DOMON domain-containing protein [Nymphaea thermarum]